VPPPFDQPCHSNLGTEQESTSRIQWDLLPDVDVTKFAHAIAFVFFYGQNFRSVPGWQLVLSGAQGGGQSNEPAYCKTGDIICLIHT
jgi:hypothetical protein